MKNKKVLIAIMALVGVLGLTGTAYAVGFSTPADITAALTGKSVSEVVQERAGGKTYGAIANEAGQLEQFKAQMLEQKKLILDQRVKDGQLTQAQADEIYNALKNNQTTCTRTGAAQMGKNYGVSFGNENASSLGQGMNRGKGQGQGLGQGQGSGQGMMRGNGTGNGNAACTGTGYGVEASE